MPTRPLRHAVVIGGSIAGLLATRVLADHFERVTLIERDALAHTPAPRKGVPQARHAHALLLRGRSILEAMFPGLDEELCAAGAALVDIGHEFGWHHGGGWRLRFESDLVFMSMSRPLLEWRIAERVRRRPEVSVLDHVRVEGLECDPADAVTGVRIAAADAPERCRTVAADLVVDATGRGSALPRWLEAAGFSAPASELLAAPVSYASRTFRRPDRWPERRALLVTGAPARRSGGLFPIEGGRWLVTLIGFFDEPPPRSPEGFLAFARSLAVPDIHDSVAVSEPLSDIVHYRFGGSLRRRYERLERLPEGLIATGDAVCSFNPVYGQGMTVSAVEAESLAEALAAARARGGIEVDFGARWFRRIGPVIDAAWQGVALEDLRFPELAGQRPARLRPLQWYMDRVHRATQRNAAVAAQFYRVVNFLDPPTTLFRPLVLVESLFGRSDGRGKTSGSAPPPSARPPMPAPS